MVVTQRGRRGMTATIVMIRMNLFNIAVFSFAVDVVIQDCPVIIIPAAKVEDGRMVIAGTVTVLRVVAKVKNEPLRRRRGSDGRTAAAVQARHFDIGIAIAAW